MHTKPRFSAVFVVAILLASGTVSAQESLRPAPSFRCYGGSGMSPYRRSVEIQSIFTPSEFRDYIMSRSTLASATRRIQFIDSQARANTPSAPIVIVDEMTRANVLVDVENEMIAIQTDDSGTKIFHALRDYSSQGNSRWIRWILTASFVDPRGKRVWDWRSRDGIDDGRGCYKFNASDN